MVLQEASEPEVVKLLLEAGANTNAADHYEGKTALHMAVGQHLSSQTSRYTVFYYQY